MYNIFLTSYEEETLFPFLLNFFFVKYKVSVMKQPIQESIPYNSEIEMDV